MSREFCRPEADHKPLLDDARNRAVVDGLRGASMLAVIAFHVLFATSRALEPGRMREFIAGVSPLLNFAWQALGSEVIFLMSGFLIASLLVRERHCRGHIDLRRYAVKRISRIVPLYLLALAVYAPLTGAGLADLPANLLFASKLSGAATIVPVGWSLEVIIQFYVVLPLLITALGNRPHRVAWLLVLIAAGLATRLTALLAEPGAATTPFYALWLQAEPAEIHRALYYLPWHRAIPFLAGTLLAVLVIDYRQQLAEVWHRHGVALWLVAGLLGLYASMLPLHDPASFLYTDERPAFWIVYWTTQRAALVASVAIVLTGVFLHAGLPGHALGRMLAWSGLAALSRNIYSIYLFHPLCLMVAVSIVFWRIDLGTIEAASKSQVALVFVVTTLLSVALAEVLGRWLERPVQNRLRSRWL